MRNGRWVVTPRRGKAVEINALWFNALKLLVSWLRASGKNDAATRYDQHAEQARASFNERFWFAEGDYLYDVVDSPGDEPNDSSCRPNQVFAISLDHPVLNQEHWGSVLAVVERELVTPLGLRSLSPKDPDYKPIYSGDLRSRDGAYHQGTVWAWLIGPFIDAWMKLYSNDKPRARKFLERFPGHLDDAGMGTIGEVLTRENTREGGASHRRECRGSLARWEHGIGGRTGSVPSRIFGTTRRSSPLHSFNAVFDPKWRKLRSAARSRSNQKRLIKKLLARSTPNMTASCSPWVQRGNSSSFYDWEFLRPLLQWDCERGLQHVVRASCANAA